MIKSVNLKSPDDGDSYQEIAVVTVYDDGERRIEHDMTVLRGSNEASCNNPTGTNGRIAVNGNFTYIEYDDGKLVLDEISQEAIDDAVAVFKVIFGEEFER